MSTNTHAVTMAVAAERLTQVLAQTGYDAQAGGWTLPGDAKERLEAIIKSLAQ